MERAALSFIVHSLMHRFDYRRSKRLGDIADSKTDNLGVGIFGLMIAHAVSNFSKEIACADLGIVFVYMKHNKTSDVIRRSFLVLA